MAEKDPEGTVRVSSSHIWNGIWAAVLIILSLGINGLVDGRIAEHPKVTQTNEWVQENRLKIDRIDKTVVKVEVILERNEKALAEIAQEIRNR